MIRQLRTLFYRYKLRKDWYYTRSFFNEKYKFGAGMEEMIFLMDWYVENVLDDNVPIVSGTFVSTGNPDIYFILPNDHYWFWFKVDMNDY